MDSSYLIRYWLNFINYTRANYKCALRASALSPSYRDALESSPTLFKVKIRKINNYEENELYIYIIHGCKLLVSVVQTSKRGII